MSAEIAVVLDASALLSYVAGRVAVGELISEVADGGGLVAVPAVCLESAHAAVSDELGHALLDLLVAGAVVRVVPLGVDAGVDDVRQAGLLARKAAGDLALGHAARTAITYEAHLATTEPKAAAAALPVGWSILEV